MPADIALRPATVLDRQQETKGGKMVTWVSLRAKDGAYTRWVLGIQYRNQAAYDRYRADYVQFKQSLEQFADGVVEEE